MTLLPIPIPEGFEIKVKADEKVKEDQILASGTTSSEFKINIGELLNVKPKELAKTLKKNPGDRVEVGMVIAKKGGVFGSKEITSSVSGTILRFDNESGDLVIKGERGKVEDILSPVDGEVAVCDNEKVVLKCDKKAFIAKNAFGEEAVGEPFEVKNTDSLALDNKVSDKIVVGANFDRELISKSLGLGGLGIITNKISESDLESFKSGSIKNPIMIVDDETLAKLIKSDGRLLLDGKKKLIVVL